ncbi:MAG TPA: hypothetical protein VGC72_07830 [Candidatus Elarobacter sp.]|jgi:hypothetical protein
MPLRHHEIEHICVSRAFAIRKGQEGRGTTPRKTSRLEDSDDVTDAIYQEESAVVRASSEANAAALALMKANAADVEAARDAADAAVRAAAEAAAKAVEDAKNSDPSAW